MNHESKFSPRLVRNSLLMPVAMLGTALGIVSCVAEPPSLENLHVPCTFPSADNSGTVPVSETIPSQWQTVLVGPDCKQVYIGYDARGAFPGLSYHVSNATIEETGSTKRVTSCPHGCIVNLENGVTVTLPIAGEQIDDVAASVTAPVGWRVGLFGPLR